MNREPGIGVVAERPHQPCGYNLGKHFIVAPAEFDLDWLRLIDTRCERLLLPIGALNCCNLATKFWGLPAHLIARSREVADDLIVIVKQEEMLFLRRAFADVNFAYLRRNKEGCRVHSI